jgi:MFS family permease
MAAISLGALIGPMMGGGLQDMVGFQLACDYTALISLAFNFIYLVVVIIPEMVK